VQAVMREIQEPLKLVIRERYRRRQQRIDSL
jgi:hypothetical protein